MEKNLKQSPWKQDLESSIPPPRHSFSGWCLKHYLGHWDKRKKLKGFIRKKVKLSPFANDMTEYIWDKNFHRTTSRNNQLFHQSIRIQNQLTGISILFIDPKNQCWERAHGNSSVHSSPPKYLAINLNKDVNNLYVKSLKKDWGRQ